MDDGLELRAWRFLAEHRVGGLKVTHVQFIDGDGGPTMNTPSVDAFYESATCETFGQAAIELALGLGMPWGEPGTLSEGAGVSSSAPTAAQLSGASLQSTQATLPLEMGSTTGATSAEAGIGGNRNVFGAPVPVLAGDR